MQNAGSITLFPKTKSDNFSYLKTKINSYSPLPISAVENEQKTEMELNDIIETKHPLDKSLITEIVDNLMVQTSFSEYYFRKYDTTSVFKVDF